jgi:inhibitor of cysteine peptidase
MRAITRATLAVGLMFSLVAFAGCGSGGGSGTPVKAGEKDNGATVSLAVGQDLRVSLPGNVTTGFDWAVAGALPSQLTSVTSTYVPSSTAVVGAGGTRTLVFRGAVAGTATLRLRYARAWETGVAPANTYTLTVEVR